MLVSHCESLVANGKCAAMIANKVFVNALVTIVQESIICYMASSGFTKVP